MQVKGFLDKKRLKYDEDEKATHDHPALFALSP